MRVIYLTLDGLSTTVFDSQVYELFNRLQKKGIDIHLLISQPIQARYKISRLFKLYFKRNVHFIFFYKKRNSLNLEKKILSLLPKNERCIVHARGPYASYELLKIKKKYNLDVEIIYDVRSLAEDEYIFGGNCQDGLKRLQKIHNDLFTLTTKVHFNFVSNELLEEYLSRYDFNPKSYLICPSAYNDRIFNSSSKPNLSRCQSVIAVYIGGTQDYQNLQKIIDRLEQYVDKIIMITTRKKEFDNHHNVICYHSLRDYEIVKLINQYNVDYGVIYRDNHLFNLISTPTKITEYWGMGLKVLAFGNAGAYSKIIEDNNMLGIVLHNQKFISEKLLKVPFEEKKKISEFTKNNFSMTNNIRQYLEFYNKIC